MGAAAYNRGTKAIAMQIDAEARAPEFLLMDDLNALPKRADAVTPFGPVHFSVGHGGWWAECPITGFGYHYKTLRDAVRAWRVTITAYINNTFVGDAA